MASQYCVGKIIKTRTVSFTKITLTIQLSAITIIAHNMFTAAFNAKNALRPAQLTNELKTFAVIEQRRYISYTIHSINIPQFNCATLIHQKLLYKMSHFAATCLLRSGNCAFWKGFASLAPSPWKP
jgi:hypothetical protein